MLSSDLFSTILLSVVSFFSSADSALYKNAITTFFYIDFYLSITTFPFSSLTAPSWLSSVLSLKKFLTFKQKKRKFYLSENIIKLFSDFLDFMPWEVSAPIQEAETVLTVQFGLAERKCLTFPGLFGHQFPSHVVRELQNGQIILVEIFYSQSFSCLWIPTCSPYSRVAENCLNIRWLKWQMRSSGFFLPAGTPHCSW